MIMLSEVGINRHIFPMIPKRGRKFEKDYVVVNKKNEPIFIAEKDSRWNIRCYKFMDYLSSLVRDKFNIDMFNENPELGAVIRLDDPRLSKHYLLSAPSNFIPIILKGFEYPKSREGELAIAYNKPIKISYKEAAKDLGWYKNDVKLIIETILKFKFKTKYEIHTFKKRNSIKSSFKISSYNNLEEDFETLFNVELNKDNCVINFNTPFGVCFIHNIHTSGYELINDVIYNLSESTQIIYRKRFFTFSKLLNVPISKEYVLKHLNITTKNSTSKNVLFKKVIKELLTIDSIEFRSMREDCYILSLGVKKKKIIKDNIIPLNEKIAAELDDFERMDKLINGKDCYF